MPLALEEIFGDTSVGQTLDGAVGHVESAADRAPAVAYNVETTAGSTDAVPLGRWVHQQRRALRAGELDPHRKELLNEAGMVWEPSEEAWETKLAALRSYRRATGHLTPRQDAA